ncbi:hypothetical protein GGX14DRAFT_356675, partial [Mycena pura]
QDVHTYKFDVKMTCSGCSGAVTRVLEKADGVSEFSVNLETQEVLVTGTIPYEDVLAKIKKTGKEVRGTFAHVPLVSLCLLFFLGSLWGDSRMILPSQ